MSMDFLHVLQLLVQWFHFLLFRYRTPGSSMGKRAAWGDGGIVSVLFYSSLLIPKRKENFPFQRYSGKFLWKDMCGFSLHLLLCLLE